MTYVSGYTYEGAEITVMLDGKTYTRRVYYRRDVGLFIRINNLEWYLYELEFQNGRSV